MSDANYAVFLFVNHDTCEFSLSARKSDDPNLQRMKLTELADGFDMVKLVDGADVGISTVLL
jgi:hypothetical protein